MAFFSDNQILANQANKILKATWEKFPSLNQEQIALTWIVDEQPVTPPPTNHSSVKSTPKSIQGFSYRGDELIYPASIIKLFYLVAVKQWFKNNMISPSAELNRAIADMMIKSSNDATSLVIDTLTNTTSGPELKEKYFIPWKYQRNEINRYLQSFGWEEFAHINVNQKTWSDGPYGRERMFVGENRENRNMLTTNAVARLFYSIVSGTIVSSQACESMMSLLQRDVTKKTLAIGEEENQINGFLGESLPSDSKLWSKAGWTSQVRHDSAYIVIPNRRPYLLIVFTEVQENSRNRDIIPFISQQFAQIE